MKAEIKTGGEDWDAFSGSLRLLHQLESLHLDAPEFMQWPWIDKSRYGIYARQAMMCFKGLNLRVSPFFHFPLTGYRVECIRLFTAFRLLRPEHKCARHTIMAYVTTEFDIYPCRLFTPVMTSTLSFSLKSPCEGTRIKLHVQTH